MTDSTPPDGPDDPHDNLDARLRAGLAAVVDEAGEPPAFPDESGGASPLPRVGGRTRVLAVAALVLAVIAVGAVVAATRGGDRDHEVETASPPTRRQGADRTLVGTRWWLVSVRKGAKDIAVDRPDVALQLRTEPPCDGREDRGCIDGDVIFASDACNGVQRRYVLRDDEIELGEHVGATTAMGCSGPLVTTLGEVYEGRSVTYEISGDELTIRSRDATLTYRASEGPFAPVAGTVLDEGEVGDTSYRLAGTSEGLEFQTGKTASDLARGGMGVGEDRGRINVMRGSVAGRAYLFGFVPADSARVVYEPTGAEAQELEIHRAEDGKLVAVGQFVDAAPATWMVVAYDADGLELHRMRWGPREDHGAGLYISEMVTAAGYQDCCEQVGARETFTVDGVAMSISSSPIEPTKPQDPRAGLTDPRTWGLQSGGIVLVGKVRGDTAVRWDCASLRYEVRSTEPMGPALDEIVTRIAKAGGCEEVRVSAPTECLDGLPDDPVACAEGEGKGD
jgi:hypothetical protein